MLQNFFSGWFCPQPRLKLLVAMLLTPAIAATSIQAASAQSFEAIASSLSQSSAEEQASDQPSVSLDPLNSPYPVPWNWVMKTYEDISSQEGSGVRYYRSHSLLSPDGEYAAYSRIQMQVQPELYHSQVSSVMFLENLRTGKLQEVKASSPLALHLLLRGKSATPGIISILSPIGWSKSSDRLLARQFEGFFNTSDVSDYAVIWHRYKNQTTTLAPAQTYHDHAMSILLGWSQTDPDRVVFRVGELGDEHWQMWTVAENGQTTPAPSIEQPIVFGLRQMKLWAGEQIASR